MPTKAKTLQLWEKTAIVPPFPPIPDSPDMSGQKQAVCVVAEEMSWCVAHAALGTVLNSGEGGALEDATSSSRSFFPLFPEVMLRSVSSSQTRTVKKQRTTLVRHVLCGVVETGSQ